MGAHSGAVDPAGSSAASRAVAGTAGVRGLEDASRKGPPSRTDPASLPLHSHVCLLYTDPAERWDVLVPFVRGGLVAGQRFLYIVAESSRGEVAEALLEGGIDVDGTVRSGALRIVGKESTYLSGGCFDPQRMLDGLEAATTAALADGYSGLRVSGEMTWMLADEPSVDRAFEYESRLNRFFPRHAALAICQYRVGAFAASYLLQAIRTHPTVIIDGKVCENPYYVPPLDDPRDGSDKAEVDRILDCLRERRDYEDRLESARSDLVRANAALQSLAVTDDLTGLLNRRGLAALASKVCAIARRERRGLLAAYIDVDGLKAVNDTYGHAAGDGLLVETARLLGDVFRESDVIARVGGDEFVILMTGADEQSGTTALGRLDDAVRRRNAATLQPSRLSLSAGTALTEPGGTFDLDDLVERADAAMYEAKRRRAVVREGR